MKFCLRFSILYKGCSKSIRKVYIKNAIGKNQENSALQAIYQNVESSTKQAFVTKLDDSQRENEKRYLNIVLDNPFATNSDDQNKIDKAQMRKNKSVKKVRQRNKTKVK